MVLLFLLGVSWEVSLVFRLLARGRFTTTSSADVDSVPLAGVSEAVVMALGSSFEALEAFEEECLRWCRGADDVRGGLATIA